jgi:hypothetical protein
MKNHWICDKFRKTMIFHIKNTTSSYLAFQIYEKPLMSILHDRIGKYGLEKAMSNEMAQTCKLKRIFSLG